MIQRQNVSISFAQGIDTKSDPKQVVAGKLLTLENGTFQSPSRIKKRNGYTGLGQIITGTSTSIGTGYSLETFNNELIETDGTKLYSYAQDLNQWASKGNIINLSEQASPVVRNNYQQTSQDSCYHTVGLQAFVWEDSSGGSRYSVIDTVTGQQFVSNASLSSTATVPKCYAIGNYIVIFIFDTSNNRLRWAYIPIVNPTTISAFTDLESDANTTVVYDATVIGSRIFLCYNNNTGGINLVYMDAFLNVSGELVVAGDAASGCMSIFGDVAQNAWVVYWNGTSVKVFIAAYTLATTLVLTRTVVETLANVTKVTGVYNGTLGQIFYDISGSPTYNYFIKTNTFTVGGTAGTPAVVSRSVGLASKAFFYNGNSFVLSTYDSSLQPTYFVLNQSGQVAAKVSAATGGGIPAKRLVPNVNSLATGKFQISYLQRDFVTTTGGTAQVYFLTGVMQSTLDFTLTALQTVDIADNLHLTGGFLYMYDGANLVEQSYHLFPEKVTITPSGAGGVILAGTYQYSAVYEWTDNFGQIERSAPSIPVSVTNTGSTSSNSVSIPTLRVTAKKGTNPVSVVLYRTQANQTIFYRVSSITSPTVNDTTADTVTIVDILGDATIIGNQQLYTTGGELENIAPPVPLSINTYKNRIIVIDAENRLNWWYSKQVIQGVPVEFSDFFVQTVDQRGGDLVVGTQMDDKLILFKSDDIFYVVGDGPAPSGANNDFTPAQLVTTGVGCVDPKSVVTMPLGLMFKSRHGIWLLDRGLNASYIGKDVEAYNSSHVTSAKLIKDQNQVRFTLDSGVTLTYDYFQQQWSVFTQMSATDSTLFQNNFTYVQSNGLVMQETPGLYTDNNQFIKLKVVTSWLSFAQLQGYQRVRRFLILGDYFSAHKLIIYIAKDFNPNPIQQDIIDAGTLLTDPVYGADSPYGSGSPYGGGSQVYQWLIHMSQQKCETVQITLEDSQASNFGQGFDISTLAFEVGIKRGTFKMPASNSFG